MRRRPARRRALRPARAADPVVVGGRLVREEGEALALGEVSLVSEGGRALWEERGGGGAGGDPHPIISDWHPKECEHLGFGK